MVDHCSSSRRERKRSKRQKDRISQLPQDVIVCILSFLSMKEAARTSILCKGWKQHWLYLPKLDFHVPQVFGKLRNTNLEMHECVKWVDSVFRCHKALALDELRIRSGHLSFHRRDISEWLSYAFSRKVRTMELELVVNFPANLLESSASLYLDNFKFLRSLSLEGVGLTQEIVDSTFSMFHSLECLKVQRSHGLSSLEVCGSSLVALKHLEITHCSSLDCIIVRNMPFLASLKIQTVSILVVEKTPKLVDFCIHPQCWKVSEYFQQLPNNFLSRLEVLKLGIETLDLQKLIEVPQLSKLKQLHIKVFTLIGGSLSLMPLTWLIKSCPKLEKFVLKTLRIQRRINEEERKFEEVPKLFLEHLKEVELIGYLGHVTADELLLYLLENAVDLERVTIYPRDLLFQKSCYLGPSDEERGKKCAQKLKSRIPANVELVIV